VKDSHAFLKKVYFFRGLSDEEILRIQEVCHQESCTPGDIIFEEGSPPDRFYIIAEGSVEVWRNFGLPDGDLLAVHGRGHLFGEMALIDELPRSATVVAKEPTRLYYIDREDFQNIIRAHSNIAVSILKSVSDMVRQSNENFVEGRRARARELEQANQALREAQLELLVRDRLSTLGKFSSLILHDIRNPISILRSLAEMTLINSADKGKVEVNAGKIIAEADRLNQIASELLDYSRGEIRLNMAVVNLPDFFGRLVEAIGERFRSRGIEIQTQVDLSEPFIMDEQRMFRVFLNLADNARKAMPHGGSFTIKVSRTNRTLKVEVTDTGVGMDAEVQKRSFEPFYSHAAQGGTGLGMSIVKSVIEAHHGTLHGSSRPGAGTTFRIGLPFLD